MDVYIDRVPPRSNQTELRLFLKNILLRFDILAFDCFKKYGTRWAVVTIANTDNGQRFLQNHGGQAPLTPLVFKKVQIRCRRSDKKDQPDMLKVRVLLEKEASMRSTGSKQGAVVKPSQPIFPFVSFQTGIWEYDRLGKLTFDSKFLDKRQGTITFGKFALVVYLAATVHSEYNWHCRIDIPYRIVEHAIPSENDGLRGAITLTLKSPPRIYRIINTEDLHLYSGAEPVDEIADIFSQFTLTPRATVNAVKRLERECFIMPGHEKSAALCMVYRFGLPDVVSAQRAWIHISKSSALSQAQTWSTMIPTRETPSVEAEYRQMETDLSSGDANVAMHFTFAVQFQLLALVLEGTLTPTTMTQLIPNVRSLCVKYGPKLVTSGIRKLQYQIPTPSPGVEAQELNLNRILTTLRDNIRDSQAIETTTEDISSKQNQHHHLVSTFKATVTPTGLLLRGPDLSVSNRVLRKYADKSEYFMRVFFADEDGQSVLHDPRASQDAVYSRFRKVLREGIMIAGRKFSFLGFSHSSLHYHTAWFMAPFVHDGKLIHSKFVIEDLGDFSHIHCSAKCAARIGQAFTDTVFAVPIGSDVHVTETSLDVERNGRCFSDGCGTISAELLETVWKRLPHERRKLRPTILQIRYRGAKGVVSLDTSLLGKQLIIRNSMTKYTARASWIDLELCGAAYKPLDLYLNHQFIKILEDLGISQHCFIDVQNDALRELEMIIRHPINAASFLEHSRSGVVAKVPTLFRLMYHIGLSFQADKFLTDIIEVAAMSTLRDMKYRARIPIEKGHLLYGIMDESNRLKEGEVYITIGGRDENGNWGQQVILKDRLVVTRAPALHPGDVQVVKAVNVPDNSPLRDLYNCIVFSQQGARDIPSQLGGGDLDGDLFHVIYDERLIPSYTLPPSEYPPTAAKDLGRPVQVEDIVDFFIEYMNSDRLGQISNKHKIRSDIKPEGTLHPDCITLAKLASDAVDFSKSGKPVDMSLAPKGNDHIRPDFMANAPNLVMNKLGSADLEEAEADDVDDPDSISILDPEKFSIRYYKSTKTLGALYRKINEPKFLLRMRSDFEVYRDNSNSEGLVQKLELYIDRETSHYQWEHYRGFAEQLREFYENNMFEIMDSMRPHRGKPLTELEVFSGNILGKKEHASTRYIREANVEVRERFDRDVGSITRRIVSGDGLKDEEDEALPRSIACFKVALEREGWEDYQSLKSWKYVTAAVCLEQLSRSRNSRLRPFLG